MTRVAFLEIKERKHFFANENNLLTLNCFVKKKMNITRLVLLICHTAVLASITNSTMFNKYG